MASTLLDLTGCIAGDFFTSLPDARYSDAQELARAANQSHQFVFHVAAELTRGVLDFLPQGQMRIDGGNSCLGLFELGSSGTNENGSISDNRY
jgi:hypothetical protein